MRNSSYKVESNKAIELLQNTHENQQYEIRIKKYLLKKRV